MRDALVAAGVPSGASCSTMRISHLGPVVRGERGVRADAADDCLGGRSITIGRSSFARHYGIDAVAFNAAPLSLQVSMWPACREWLARVKGRAGFRRAYDGPENFSANPSRRDGNATPVGNDPEFGGTCLRWEFEVRCRVRSVLALSGQGAPRAASMETPGENLSHLTKGR